MPRCCSPTSLGCKRIDLYGCATPKPAPEEVRQRFRELIRRRVEGCPVAYLVGRKEFFSLELEVIAGGADPAAGQRVRR